ncbi:MAG: hypothetical protein MUF31_03080 [Akkermansiaceae bacterium]|jgi:hypothetical protein|nr:hypothetical protein [Akkermansiaceae bacterium]
MQFNHDVTDRIQKLAAQGQDIASRQEAGMSETPLTQLFGELRNNRKAEPVEVALVGLDDDSVPLVLSRLLGEEYPLCRVVVPDRLGYTEVHLRESGYIFESGSERREFDQPQSLLKALEETRSSTDSHAHSLGDPMRVSLKAPAGRAGVVLLIPTSLESLSNKPALLSIIATRASFLVLAGRSDHALDADSKLTLNSLLENLAGYQCVVTDEAPVPPGDRSKIGWLSWPGQAFGFPAHFLSAADSPAFLPFLEPDGPQAGFRDYLGAQQSTARIDETLSLLDESLQAELEQLANRMRLMDSGVAGAALAPGDFDARVAGEEVKNRLQEDLDAIKKNREDAAKRALLVDGDLYKSLHRISESLRVDDIDKTPKETVIKLALSEDKQNEITDALRHEMRAIVMNDLAVIDETVTATREELEGQLEKTLGLRTRLHLDPLDRTAWWESVVSLARPEIRYRSEMPIVTMGKRFSEARGGLSLVMVAGGLLTGLQAFVDAETLKSIKVGLYALMIPVLVGGLIWTFVSVKKRDRITLEKELDRLREGVLSELRKVSNELLRVQATQIAALLGKISKQLNSQAAELLKKHETQAKGAREEETRRARERNKGIEQRSREKTQQRTELARLKTSVGEIRRLLSDWLRGLNAPARPALTPSAGAVAPSPSRIVPTVPPSPSRINPPS